MIYTTCMLSDESETTVTYQVGIQNQQIDMHCMQNLVSYHHSEQSVSRSQLQISKLDKRYTLYRLLLDPSFRSHLSSFGSKLLLLTLNKTINRLVKLTKLTCNQKRNQVILIDLRTMINLNCFIGSTLLRIAVFFYFSYKTLLAKHFNYCSLSSELAVK